MTTTTTRILRHIRFNQISIFFQKGSKYFTANGEVTVESDKRLRHVIQEDTKRRILLNRALRAGAAFNAGKTGGNRKLVWTGTGASFGNAHAFTCND